MHKMVSTRPARFARRPAQPTSTPTSQLSRAARNERPESPPRSRLNQHVSANERLSRNQPAPRSQNPTPDPEQGHHGFDTTGSFVAARLNQLGAGWFRYGRLNRGNAGRMVRCHPSHRFRHATGCRPHGSAPPTAGRPRRGRRCGNSCSTNWDPAATASTRCWLAATSSTSTARRGGATNRTGPTPSSGSTGSCGRRSRCRVRWRCCTATTGSSCSTNHTSCRPFRGAGTCCRAPS